MTLKDISPSAHFKLELMFDGIRYSESLGAAAEHSYPNYYPYRFEAGEDNPTGQPKAAIPYLLTTDDETAVRIKGCGTSSWHVNGSLASGYRLMNHGQPGIDMPVEFSPRPRWLRNPTADGFLMARAGISLHGDMAIINAAPGCEYFLADKVDGKSMRCKFCVYGAPDDRMESLGQTVDTASLPERTYARLRETLATVLAETEIRHIYLVGGSMLQRRKEGERFIEIARQVQTAVEHTIPVTCGSGALLHEHLDQLHRERLVDNVCFNLEVWSEKLFSQICPGKHNYVGYGHWIKALEHAVTLWGAGHVYSAMVGGIELEPEYGLSTETAVDLAIRGADELCRRGIIPVYSLYWPVAGRDHPDHLAKLRAYFEQLNVGCYQVRKAHKAKIWDGFMCHRCAYMQLECDVDRAATTSDTKG